MSEANPKHVALVRSEGWKHRSPFSEGPLDLMDADLRNLHLGYWPDRIHEQTSHIRTEAFFNARFVRARLSQAVFQCVYFGRADFSGATLDGARIEGCDFSEAIFRGTDLRGAVFASRSVTVFDPPRDDWEGNEFEITPPIRLRGALLDRIDAANADFSGVEFDHTIIIDTDLSTVRGLDSASHVSSSTISQSTFRLSHGQIPRRFLQGIGLQDWEIETVKLYRDGLSNSARAQIVERALTFAQPRSFFSVFISHSHADKAFALRLHEKLQAAGVRCWLDEHQLLPGDDIHEQVDRGIRLWDKVLLCCSEASLTSWWVDSEIESAFQKEQRLMKERGHKILTVIPLDLDGYLLEQWHSGKAPQVRSRLAADFRRWQQSPSAFDHACDRLIRALELGEAGREPPPIPQL